MTKKTSSEILADENRIISLDMVKLGKFSTESENFLEMGKILKQRNASLPQWDERPALQCATEFIVKKIIVAKSVQMDLSFV